MKKIKPDPLQFIRVESGVRTFQEIVGLESHYEVYDCKLTDGDEVALTFEIAQGVLLIHQSLSPENQLTMAKMTVLELLNIYDEALKHAVLIPSKLLVDTRSKR